MLIWVDDNTERASFYRLAAAQARLLGAALNVARNCPGQALRKATAAMHVDLYWHDDPGCFEASLVGLNCHQVLLLKVIVLHLGPQSEFSRKGQAVDDIVRAFEIAQGQLLGFKAQFRPRGRSR